MGSNADSDDAPDEAENTPPDPIDIYEVPSAARSDGQLYAPPRTVPPTTKHRTFEVETVKLADGLDPRKAKTIRRDRAPIPLTAPEPSAAPKSSVTLWLVAAVLSVAIAIVVLMRARPTPTTAASPSGQVAGPARAPARPATTAVATATVTATTVASVAPRATATDQPKPAKPTASAVAKPASPDQPLF